jgi:membrane protein
MFAYFRAPLGWVELSKRTINETLSDGCPGLAAQLAFYFLLAVFPALIFVVALLSYLPIESSLDNAVNRLDPNVPSDVLALIRVQIDQVVGGSSGHLLTLGIAGAIWSSSSAMTAIITALNRAFDIEEWRPWWKTRVLSIVLTIGLAVFVVTAFALVVIGGDIGRWAARWLGLGDTFTAIWPWLQWPLAVGLVMLAIDLVYVLAPNAETEWVWITPGSLLAAGLWLAASVGFRLYVQNFADYSAVYGTIGGVIVLMLWFYLAGFALLVGAELNSEIDKALPTHDDAPQGPGRQKRIGPAAEHAATHPAR